MVGAIISFAAPLNLNTGEFPIGVYSADPQSDENFALLKSLGINYVHTYSIGHNTPENNKETRKFMDMTHKHGLKVMFNLMGRKWVKGPDGQKKLKQLIDQFKSHPALGFWYLYDEPRASQLPQLRKLYSILRQETPLTPVAIVTPWIEQWKCFTEICDILMVDNYPVRDEKFPESSIFALTKFADEAIALGKPVMVAPQIMSWKTFAYQLKNQGYNEKDFRFPNEQELRYWSYSTLAQGGRGLIFYSFYHAFQKGKNLKWVKEVFGKVTKEVSEFSKITAPANNPTILKRAGDNNFRIALWNREGGSYLVLINNYPLTRKRVNRWMENQIMTAELVPWGATRKIEAKITGGRLRIAEEINPWEVLVWKIKRK
jgi:hypothetical protein